MRTSGFSTQSSVLLGVMIGLLVSVGAGCGSMQAGSSGRNTDTITRDDVDGLQIGSGATAYDVVQRLHPQWLRKRSPRGPRVNTYQEEMEGDIVVYLDGTRVGGPDALQSIRADAIAVIEYLNAAKSVRLGTGHQHGAILVRSR